MLITGGHCALCMLTGPGFSLFAFILMRAEESTMVLTSIERREALGLLFY